MLQRMQQLGAKVQKLARLLNDHVLSSVQDVGNELDQPVAEKFAS